MIGTLYKLCDNGHFLPSGEMRKVGNGDFNFRKGEHPVTGRLGHTADFFIENKGGHLQLTDAQINGVAGFGIRIIGFEMTFKKRGNPEDMRQEWWFVPRGHEESGRRRPEGDAAREYVAA